MDLNKLRSELKERQITQAELASSMHITPQALNAKLYGRSPITIEEAVAIVEFAKIENPADIFFADNYKRKR